MPDEKMNNSGHEKDPARITAEELFDRIRKEAEDLERAGSGSGEDPESAFVPDPEERRPEPVAGLQDLLEVGSFLHLPPEWFIRAAYLCLLKREPDPAGLENYLEQLRSGQVSRIGLLGRMAKSPEGQSSGVRIKGLRPLFILTELRRYRFPGKILQILAAPFLLPPALGPLLAGQGEALLSYVQARTAENQARDLATRKAVHQVRRATLACERRLRGSGAAAAPPAALRDPAPAPDPALDALYATFEDEFRGTRGEVKDRLGLYLPRVLEALELSGSRAALDLGCGRGEWLELLREMGCSGRGIDLNPVFVRECRDMGLDVTQEEALACLQALEPDSHSLITAFQLIEHLPLETLISLMDEALRVLAPGGLLLFETPNPRHLLVGAGDFYRDPSHRNPVFPDTLAFIGEQRGFRTSAAYFLDPAGRRLRPSRHQEFNALEDYLRVSRDFAWLGYKG